MRIYILIESCTSVYLVRKSSEVCTLVDTATAATEPTTATKTATPTFPEGGNDPDP